MRFPFTGTRSRQQMKNFYSSDSYGVKFLAAAGISLLFILIFYPGFVFLKKTPMLGMGWELMDPVVSFANFEPSFRVFRYELLEHGNMLWSNLRSMGLPLLANDIHAAPMFPLTLLLCWLPPEYFWNIFVVARLLLMGMGTFLLARNFLRFQTIPAAFFVLCFIYSFFVLQWMNHSWQNGLLAGIWYLNFLYLLPGVSRPPYRRKRFLVVLGLTVSVYSMVTCGFPESAAMSAVLVVLVYTPFFIQLLFAGRIRLRHYIFDLVIAHCIGFALSAAQVFSIFEMLSLYEAADQRGTYGLRQFHLQDFFPFWAEKIGLITGAQPPLFKDSRAYLGLVPLLLFLLGCGWVVKNISRLDYRQVGAFLCGIFIMLKYFPFWDAFNRMVGNLPVLRESYFFVYFFSIFLWFFAYFVAQGMQALLAEDGAGATSGRYAWSGLVLLSAAAVVGLLWLSVPILYQVSLPELLQDSRNSNPLVILAVFLGAFIVAEIIIYARINQILRLGAGWLLLSLAVIEFFIVLPRDFRPLPLGFAEQSRNLALQLQSREIAPAEVRIQDPDGIYVSGGIATIDNGAPAVLPARLFVFRRTLFDVRGGYFPVRATRFDYSWAMTSTGLFPSGEYIAGSADPPWNTLQSGEEKQITIDEVKVNGLDFTGRQGIFSGNDTIYLRGWAVDSQKDNPEVPQVFIVFRSGNRQISWPAVRMYRPDVAYHFDDRSVMHAGWHQHIPLKMLSPGRYAILVRATLDGGNSYFEKDTGLAVNIRKAAEVPPDDQPGAGRAGSSVQFAGSTTRGLVYYDNRALPRAYLAGRCRPVAGFPEAVRHIRDKETFRLGDVFVEDLPASEQDICLAVGNGEPSRVAIEVDRGKEVALGPVTGPGVLILNDNYYPGWQAFDRVSGERLQIRPANITVRAIVLPEEKEYNITYLYEPEWLGLVQLMAGGALLGLTGLFFLALGRRQKSL